jgi:hypothetical protein
MKILRGWVHPEEGPHGPISPQKEATLEGVQKALQAKMNQANGNSGLYENLKLANEILTFIRNKNPGLDAPGNTGAQCAVQLQKLLDEIDVKNPSKEAVERLHNTLQSYNVDFTAGKIAKFAHGKVKEVSSSEEKEHVYETPRKPPGPFGWVFEILNEAEMREEVKTVREIGTALGKKGLEGKNLLLDFEKYIQRIEGKYTVRASKASRNFEEQLGDHHPFPESARNGLGFLRGIRDLHAAGYVHGDIKPENALVFDKEPALERVKIADFGKTRKMEEKKHATNAGNPRFAPPEVVLSKEGEVFSTALVLIRSLEEEVLPSENDMMLSPARYKDQSPESEKRRGIEKFLVQNQECVQTEAQHLKGIGRRIRMYGQTKISSIPQEDIERTVDNVHAYIDTLIGALIAKHPESERQLVRIEKLLKRMTDADLEERPTAAQATQELEDILS